MTTYIALFRSINLGGHNKVKMVDIRELISELGFANARTVLQSGNLVFESDTRSPSQLEHHLKEAAEVHLGLKTELFARTAKEWEAIVAANPYPDEAYSDPGHLIVMFLKDAPDRNKVTALEGAVTGREVIHVNGRQLYIVYPDGIGRSKLTYSLIERKLSTNGTTRGWKTMLKVASLAA